VKPKKNIRRRLFVDVKLQGTVILHIVLCWLMCQLMILIFVYGCKAANNADHIVEDMRFFCRSTFFCTLGFLPFCVGDILRLSNRFAGPMLRFRRAVQDLGRGAHVEPIRFRDGDFWQDLATDFNVLVERVQGQGGKAELEDPLASRGDETVQPMGVGGH